MRRLAAAAALALVWAPAALAVEGKVVLPDPSVRLTVAPPLSGASGPGRVPRTGRTNEVVLVGIDETGKPASVAVDQTIELLGKGDYSFSVPGPVTDVRAPAGLHSQPGLLDRAIVWQGFSPGGRVLAAHARLDVGEAGRSLPLAVGVQTLVDGRPLAPGERASGQLETIVTVRNRTAARVATIGGTGSAPELARALDLIRGRLATSSRIAPPLVTATTRPVTRTIDVPFVVRGTVTLPPSATGITAAGGTVDGHRVRFSGTAGTLVVRIRAHVTDATAPHVALAAVPVRDVAGLRPPGGGRWRAAVAARRAGGRQMLDTAVGTLLRLARLNQFSAFLATPGTFEQTRARYEYARAAPVARAVPGRSRGGGAAAAIATLALAMLGAGVAVVAWAYL